MLPDLDYLDLIGDTLTYGNYAGLGYSAGAIGGTITETSTDPAPVDAYDALFYQHDLAYQQASDSAEYLQADAQLVEGVYGLLQDAVSDWFV